jgi:hypothetical protein
VHTGVSGNLRFTRCLHTGQTTEEAAAAEEEHGSSRHLGPHSSRRLSSHSLGGKGGAAEAFEVEAPTGWRRCFPARPPKEEPKDPEVKQVGAAAGPCASVGAPLPPLSLGCLRLRACKRGQKCCAP